MPYTAEAFQNEFLALGATEVNSIVTVTSSGAEGGRRTAGATEIIIVDASGSMQAEGRITAARQAAKAAVECIDDGVHFAIIAGVSTAQQLFPAPGQLAVSSPESRDEAKRSIERLQASGGTAIGAWLLLAAQLFGLRPGDIAHAILLTDGENGERHGYLETVLDSIAGKFVCDARGVGVHWKVAELRKIAEAMLGTVDIVAKPADLTAAFQQMMTAAMGKTSGDVQLKVWTPVNSTVRFVKQVLPEMLDLTGKRVDDGPRAGTPFLRHPLIDAAAGVCPVDGGIGDRNVEDCAAAVIGNGAADTVVVQGSVRVGSCACAGLGDGDVALRESAAQEVFEHGRRRLRGARLYQEAAETAGTPAREDSGKIESSLKKRVHRNRARAAKLRIVGPRRGDLRSVDGRATRVIGAKVG